MNDTVSAPAPRPAITDAERARRAYAVSFAEGSTFFSGGILTDEAKAINARFVAGELNEDEWLDAVLASDTVRLGA